jgi:hypothetical protein
MWRNAISIHFHLKPSSITAQRYYTCRAAFYASIGTTDVERNAFCPMAVLICSSTSCVYTVLYFYMRHETRAVSSISPMSTSILFLLSPTSQSVKISCTSSRTTSLPCQAHSFLPLVSNPSPNRKQTLLVATVLLCPRAARSP